MSQLATRLSWTPHTYGSVKMHLIVTNLEVGIVTKSKKKLKTKKKKNKSKPGYIQSIALLGDITFEEKTKKRKPLDSWTAVDC